MEKETCIGGLDLLGKATELSDLFLFACVLCFLGFFFKVCFLVLYLVSNV